MSITMNLSHSRVTKYDFCPRAYRHYYIDGWKPKRKKVPLLFGDAVDQAIQTLFKKGVDPVPVFEAVWNALKEAPVDWGKRNSWEGLLSIGKGLLARFVAEELPRFSDVALVNVQRRLQAEINGVTVVGYLDLYAKVDGLITLTDFKTAQSAYR